MEAGSPCRASAGSFSFVCCCGINEIEKSGCLCAVWARRRNTLIRRLHMREAISDRWMFGKYLGLTLAALSLTVAAHGATLKKIVAVSSFENKTTWRGQVDLGDGMADQLTDALMQSGQFSVMERQHLGAV